MCPHGISVEKYCPACAKKFPANDDTLTCTEDDAVLLPITRDPLLGKVIDGKFEILELIGAGGSSMVYRAKQIDLGRMVAFKLLRTDLVSSAEKIQRFGMEARLASRLIHKNICTVYDYGIISSGQPYLVLEIVEGKSLAKLLKEEGVLPAARALRLLGEIAAGLKEAHTHNIIHRDLKPSNIMVVKNGDMESVKLIDFGLAKTFDLDLDEQIASSGYMVGTPSYMSPEQVLGQSLDVRTDVYSLGCILYEMLSGKKAVDGTTAFEIMSKHVQSGPERLDEGTISDDLQEFTFKCLHKDADKRFQSMQEISDCLAAIKGDTSSSRNPIRFVARRMRQPSGYAALAVAAAWIVGLSYWAMNNTGAKVGVPSANVSQSETAAGMIAQFEEFEAKNELDRADEIGKKAFGWMNSHGYAHSPEMIRLCKDMQRLYIRQLRTQQTAPYIAAAFEAQKAQALALKNPKAADDALLEAYKEAGNSYYTSNQEVASLPYLKEWLARLEKKVGADNKQCTEPLMSLVRANLWSGRHQDSDFYLQRLLKLCAKHYKGEDEFYLSAMREGLELYMQMNDLKRASAIADEAVVLSEKAPPRLRAQVMERAARTAAAVRDYDKAVKLTDAALAGYRAWDDAHSRGSQDNLLVQKGRYLRALKRYAQSEDVLKLALSRVATSYTDGSLYKWALDEYIRTLRDAGRTSEADKIKRAGRISAAGKQMRAGKPL